MNARISVMAHAIAFAALWGWIGYTMILEMSK